MRDRKDSQAWIGIRENLKKESRNWHVSTTNDIWRRPNGVRSHATSIRRTMCFELAECSNGKRCWSIHIHINSAWADSSTSWQHTNLDRPTPQLSSQPRLPRNSYVLFSNYTSVWIFNFFDYTNEKCFSNLQNILNKCFIHSLQILYLLWFICSIN